jgi:hypothetical protein
MRTIGIFTSLVLTALVGCGPASQDNPATNNTTSSDAGGDARDRNDSGTIDPGPSSDSGTPSSDTGPSDCVGKGGDDEPDDDGVDSNCDGADGRSDKDIYVNPTEGSDTNAGTASAPFGTIGKAVAVAATRIDANIFLAAGSYSLDELKVSGKVRMYGGYGAKFIGKPNRDLTTIDVAPEGLLLTGTGGDAKLAHLTVVGQSPKSAEQPSAYALRSKIDLLQLDDVVVRAGDGRSGTDGDKGLSGDPGLKGCNANQLTSTSAPCGGITICEGVKQPNYTAGAYPGYPNAEGKHPGTTTATEWCATPPCAAELATSGTSGSDGKDALKSPVFAEGLLQWTNGTDGSSNGTPGFGAPGGAGYAWWNGASGGSGGCPGKGGAAGTSGGGAIAVAVLSGELKVMRSSIMTGFAGDGGSGGEGGDGGVGGAGGWPLSATTSCDPKLATDKCATYGGLAGAGGRGGHGGGGAGGWTIGVLTVSGAKADVDSATTFTLGKPGVGGAGNGGGYAPSGDKKTTYAIP